MDGVLRLADWMSANHNLHLRRVRRQRLSRLRSLCEAGDRPVPLNNQVLLGHAEVVEVGSGLLGDAACGTDRLRDLPEPVDPVRAAEGVAKHLSEMDPRGGLKDAVSALWGLTPHVDSLLHATTKRGRDHALHMSATALFCQFLGDSVVPASVDPVPHDTPDSGASIASHAMAVTGLSYPEWCLALWFAGLFHDIGYPFARFMEVSHLAAMSSQQQPAGGPPAVHFLGELQDLMCRMSRSMAGTDSSVVADAVAAMVAGVIGEGTDRRSMTVIERARQACTDQRLREYLRHGGLVDEILDLQPEARDAEGEKGLRVLNHGLISSLVCVTALRAAQVSPLEAGRADWLRYALQAMAIHDFDVGLHKDRSAKEAAEAGAPVGREHKDAPPCFLFGSDPVSFLLRLADKVQHWERHVRGKYELTQECEEIALGGVLWKLRNLDPDTKQPAETGQPQWVGCPRLVLHYADSRRLAAAGWDHSLVSADLTKHLAELPFPESWRMPLSSAGTRTMSFQLVLPEVHP